jgi:hypothetical protein
LTASHIKSDVMPYKKYRANIRMVLLCSNSTFDIKKTHILKSLEKKRDNFKVDVEPLKTSIKIPNIEKNIVCNNITDAEIHSILNKK